MDAACHHSRLLRTTRKGGAGARPRPRTTASPPRSESAPHPRGQRCGGVEPGVRNPVIRGWKAREHVRHRCRRASAV